MKHLVILLSLLSILLGGCGGPVDPVLKFSPGSYIIDTGDEVESVRDVTRARTVIVVWFWTECSYCQHELQDIQNVYAEIQKVYELEVVGVSVGSPREDVVKFIRKYGLSFPIILDHGSPPSTGVPYTILVRNGKIIDGWIGAVSVDIILEALSGR